MGPIELGVLGPVTAMRGGTFIDVGGPLPRTLLAMLVASRGRVIAVDRIIEELWEGSPPPTAVATLHGYVSRLRAGLDPERGGRGSGSILVRQGPGYVLRVAPEQIDAERFTLLTQRGARLLREGQPEQAASVLDEGLSLWRGPAFADCRPIPFVAVEATRLDGMRAAAREDRAEAALRLAEPAAAIADLEVLVADQPLRERAWELLGLAHYRADGQAAALATIRAARDHLVEELGLDPGPRLRKLEAAVLAQSQDLDPVIGPSAPGGVLSQPALPAKNLPESVSAFIGRQTEVAAVTRLLSRHRLVTLVGAAGSGKTRLALEVARRQSALDGPWWANLADLTDPEDLHFVVADALSLADPASPRALADLLRSRRTLLVLDNCEHLIDAAAALVDTLLTRTPMLRVLATSREPLAVPGEAMYDVQPLPTDGVDSDAVALFCDRATMVMPDWRPTAEEIQVVTQICRDLDGIPLAIELAAANTRLLSVHQLAAGLNDRFALLHSASRTAPARHRSLEAAVTSSFDTLSPTEQAFFCELSIFEGGFDLAAARQVADEAHALPTLGRLVAKSLVIAELADHERRFRMLVTLREYAAQRLSAADHDDLARRHREWVRDLVETGAPRLRSADAAPWLLRLERELPNIRAAMASALAAGDSETALRIATSTYWFCYRRGHAVEGMRWLDEALEQSAAGSPWLLAQAHVGRASLHYLSGRMAEAGRAIGEAQSWAITADDPELQSISAVYAAYFHAAQGRLTQARDSATSGLALARQVEQPWLISEALMILGQVERTGGDSYAAERALNESVEVGRACGHWWAAGSAGWIAAKIAVDVGEPDRAVPVLLDLALEFEDQRDITSWLVVVQALAGALAMTGQASTGAILLGAVETIGNRVGFSPEQMDPVDAQRNQEAVRVALTPTQLGANLERGRGLSEAQLIQLLAEWADHLRCRSAGG